METFDTHIERLREYLINIETQAQVREIQCPSEIDKLLQELPIKIGSQEKANIILKEDTAVELGNPSLASCAFILWTSNLQLLKDGRITLIGPDIPESIGQSLPFAQILLIGGSEIKDQHHLVLEQHQLISNKIEGYMIRLAPQRHRMWTRVSRVAAEKGFSFETLGKALMAIYKSELRMIEASEVVFITSSKEDIKELEKIASEVNEIKNIALAKRFGKTEDGFYECISDVADCAVCPEQLICDEIRDIIRLRRKSKAST